jgi:hypothetical protein
MLFIILDELTGFFYCRKVSNGSGSLKFDMINCCGNVVYSMVVSFIEISYADIQKIFGKRSGVGCGYTLCGSGHSAWFLSELLGF